MKGNINLIWENNHDTRLTASNLSKILNVNSESPFIVNTLNANDKSLYADFVIKSTSDIAESHINGIVYVTDDDKFISVIKSSGNLTYSDKIIDILKILPNTKIGMSYTNLKKEKIYLNYDVGNDGLLFSHEFVQDSIYYIYLYTKYEFLNDKSEIKVVSINEDLNNTGEWKDGNDNINSPSGKDVVSIRKIGGFSTNNSGHIITSSLWDISTFKKSIISEKYYTSENDKIRELSAKDLLFNNQTIQNALSDLISRYEIIERDFLWLNFRNGLNLEYSYDSNFLPLKITKGLLTVNSKRVKIDDDIYLKAGIKINNNTEKTVSNITILQSKPNNIHDTTNIYEGLWRVYIDETGQIILREGDDFHPTFYNNSNKYGWYYNNERCLGKFIVNSGFYIEKMSINNTFDIIVPKNTLYFLNSSVCPDGLFICDGKFHDITGRDVTIKDNIPKQADWNNSIWEQTPEFMGKTFKMYDNFSNNSNTLEPYLYQKEFKIIEQDDGTNKVQGDSEDSGATGGSNTHKHGMKHDHNPGTLNIIESGEHKHLESEVVSVKSSETIQVSRSSGDSADPDVSNKDHKHITSINESGGHIHDAGKFSGKTSEFDGNTSSISNWSPYKEVLICIKK